MMVIKKLHNQQLLLRFHDHEVEIRDIARETHLVQSFPLSEEVCLSWSATSNHFVAVSQYSARTFALSQENSIQSWKELSMIPLALRSVPVSVNFSFPLLFVKASQDTVILNVLSGEKRSVSDNKDNNDTSQREFLSKSGLFLLVEDSPPACTPNSVDSLSDTSTFSIYSLVPLTSPDTITDNVDIADLKKTEIDLRRVSSSPPVSYTWRPRTAGANYELLSVVYQDYTVAIFAISHDRIMEDDGIMAIALNAVLTARSLNNEHDTSLHKMIEADRHKMHATSLVPVISVVAVLDGIACARYFSLPLPSVHAHDVGGSSNEETTGGGGHSHSGDFTVLSQWFDTSVDPATMIEEDNDSTPLLPTSTKLALPPVVKKTKRVELTHQGFWIALQCGHGSELKLLAIRVGYEVQTMSFCFDLTSQVRARITYAHNGNLSVKWSQRVVALEGYFSAHFRQLVAMQAISIDHLTQSFSCGYETPAIVTVDVIQVLHLRNKSGEFRKAMESNYLLDSNTLSPVDTAVGIACEMGYVRHVPHLGREGRLLRLPSVAVLGLQQHRSLPKLYLLPIANTSCRRLESGKETTHVHRPSSMTGQPSLPSAPPHGHHQPSGGRQRRNSKGRRDMHRWHYVLDDSDFVLCGFEDGASVMDVYIRDPAYLSGGSQLSPRPKASTSSLEEIHRGRYGTNPSIYYVDIIPDEQYGLGLRLDEEKDHVTGYIKVIINSFKPHPITNEPMAAELTCKIAIGDEIMGANTVSFVNKSQSFVIQTMKSLLATNHGNLLRLVMKRGVSQNDTTTTTANKGFSLPLYPTLTHQTFVHEALEANDFSSSSAEASPMMMTGMSHHVHTEFKALSPVQTLSLHPLKAHVQIDIQSTLVTTTTGVRVSPCIVDANTLVVLDEVGQHEVTVFVVVFIPPATSTTTSSRPSPSSTAMGAAAGSFELHVYQLCYQAAVGQYVTLHTVKPFPLTTLRLPAADGAAATTATAAAFSDITMATHLLHAPERNDLSFSITIYHRPPIALSTNTPLLQTTVEGRLQRTPEDALLLKNVVELCRSPIQHFLETFRIDQSVHSRCLEQYARMHGQELRRQAQEDNETNFDATNNATAAATVNANAAGTTDELNGGASSAATATATATATSSSAEVQRRRKEWSFLDTPVSVDVFLSTSRFFTMAREVNHTIDESLVDIVSILMQLQGHNVLYNVEAADRQWTERNSNDAGQILQILEKRNYIGRFQDYVRSKLKPYVDYRAKEFIREYHKHRNDMFTTWAWQGKCNNTPWLSLGELQATCSALYVIDHLAEVLKFASRVYLHGHRNAGFVKYLTASEALRNPKDDWRLLSTLLVQGQGYVQLDGYAMNSILYAMTKRGYTSVFLHMAKKLESHKPEIFLRGRKRKAAEVIDDGEDDYKRTLTALALDTNRNGDANGSSSGGSSGGTAAGGSSNPFAIGGSALYEAKKAQEAKEAQRQAQSQFIPMYASMTSVINAMFSASQEALFVIFVDNFNVLGREEDTSRLQMWLELGKDVSYTPASNEIPADATPVPVWQHVDLLTYATRMKVSLWLHDLAPLVQLILRHALKQFKTNKNAMEVFLDLVIIGKTETLLQLARTDPSPSGKQLVTLLNQVDEAFQPAVVKVKKSKRRTERQQHDGGDDHDSDDDSDDDSDEEEDDDDEDDEETRIKLLVQKLRKNADALVRKKRYREAAAVLLLVPTASMIKSALNLLAFQFNAPFLAHLVARCVEYRVYCHGELSQQKLERYCLREMMRSNYDALRSRLGYVHGIYTTQLIERDMLPDLWRTMEMALRSATSPLSTVQEQERRSSAYYHLEGIPCLQTALVLALWTQKVSLMQETFHRVLQYVEENLTFHPENIGDFARKIVLPSATTTDSSSSSSSFVPTGPTGAATAAAAAAAAVGAQQQQNTMGGIWTGKLGIPPMLMHEIHVGLTKSCAEDFSADDLLIIQNFLRVTYGEDMYRVYAFVELFLSLEVWEAYARVAGGQCRRRFAAFRTKLYTTLGMEEEALQFQATTAEASGGGSATSSTSTSSTVTSNAFVTFCRRMRDTLPGNFTRVYDTLCTEVMQRQAQAQAAAQQRENELAQRLAALTAASNASAVASTAVEGATAAEESSVPKMAFNFASMGRSSAATSTSTNQSRGGSSKSMLDAFDAPPAPAAAPRRAAGLTTTTTRNMLDDFDAPPPPRKTATAAAPPVRNMLDDFDAPPPPRKTATAAAPPVRNMLDDFDAPPPPRKTATAAAPPVRNMLDDFDAPPPPRKTAATATAPSTAAAAVTSPSVAAPSALDVFDPPTRPSSRPVKPEVSTAAAVDPFAMATTSALDAFDLNARPRQGRARPADVTPTPPPTSAATTAAAPATVADAAVSLPSSAVPAVPVIPTAPAATAQVKSALDFDMPVRPTRPARLTAADPATTVPSPAAASVSQSSTTKQPLSVTPGPPSSASAKPPATLSSVTSQPTSAAAAPAKRVPPPNPFQSPTRPTTSTATTTATATATPNRVTSSAAGAAVVSNPFAPPTSSVAMEERVRQFYQEHNPSKLASVPEILEKYRGREQELLLKLQKQYGVAPPTSSK